MRRKTTCAAQPGPAILLGLALTLAAVLACNAPGDDLVINISIDDQATAVPEAGGAESESDPIIEGGMTLTEALAVPPVDGRPETVRLMGQPDTFRLTFQDMEGTTVRLEEWTYYDYESRLDFVDGELLWTLDIEPLPDGSIFAQYYAPLDFTAYASRAEVRAQLGDDVPLIEESLAEMDAPGAAVLAGPQIMLGFEDDRLVYVETYALSAEAAQ